MRVLWLSCSAPNFCYSGDCHNGGGWISSLLEQLSTQTSIELGIVYEGKGEWGEKKANIVCYPISVFNQKRNKLLRLWNPVNEEKIILPHLKKAISDFKPDVIHIWGSESAYGLIASECSIPCILHIQGMLTPYYNAMFPPGVCRTCVIRSKLFSITKLVIWLLLDRMMRYRAERERRIFKLNINYLGRTEWDHSVLSVYRPDAHYFYGAETLRGPFLNAQGIWHVKNHQPFRIISVLSMPLYKGHDLILKTANILKNCFNLNFIWEVYGVHSMSFWEKALSIHQNQVNVKTCGTATAEALVSEMLNSDVFVHPSYIDNSPNSLCEAQLLGMPVVATYAGGIPSLVENEHTGLLVPANDPWQMAERIHRILKDSDLAQSLGRSAAKIASIRHNPKNVSDSLIEIYRHLI